VPISLALLTDSLRHLRSQRRIELGCYHLLDDVADPFADGPLDRVAIERDLRFAFTARLATLAHGRPPSAPAAKRAQLFGLVKQPEDDAFFHFPPESRHYRSSSPQWLLIPRGQLQ